MLKTMLGKYVLMLALMCSVFSVEARHVAFMDKVFDVEIPNNYCTLPEDSDYYRFNKILYGKNVKFGFIAAPCSDIRDLTEGKRSSLPHYLAIEQIGIAKKFIRFKLGKFAYFTLITSFKPASFEKFENRLNSKIADYNISLSNVDYSLYDKTSKYLLFRGTAKLHEKGNTKNVVAYAYTSLLYKIPIVVHVFDEEPDEQREKDSLALLRKAVSSL